MSTTTAKHAGQQYDNEVSGSPPHIAAARHAVEIAFGPIRDREFTVRFWDGSVDSPTAGSKFVLIVRRAGALRRAMSTNFEPAAGESTEPSQ